MTLKDAINFFESLKTETTKKSEIKVYEKFLHILTALKGRTFTADEIQSIENELDHLNLKSNSENSKKFYKKALSKFETYLKETFSLTTKGHYTNMSVSLGILFGVAFGGIIGSFFEKPLGLSFGMCIGMFVGAFIGNHLDSKAKETGNLL